MQTCQMKCLGYVANQLITDEDLVALYCSGAGGTRAATCKYTDRNFVVEFDTWAK